VIDRVWMAILSVSGSQCLVRSLEDQALPAYLRNRCNDGHKRTGPHSRGSDTETRSGSPLCGDPRATSSRTCSRFSVGDLAVVLTRADHAARML